MTVWMLTMGEFNEGAWTIELFHAYADAKAEAEKWIEQSSFEDWEWDSDFSASGGRDLIQIEEMFIR